MEGYGWAGKNGGGFRTYTTTITNNRTTVKKPEKIVRVPAMRVEEV